MRCLALAQAWQDAGGRAVFAMSQSTESIGARLAQEQCDVVDSIFPADDLQQTISAAQERNCKWIVVDGYQFDADYQRGLKAADLRVLFLDDYGHSRHYAADLVLNADAGSTIASPRIPSS